MKLFFSFLVWLLNLFGIVFKLLLLLGNDLDENNGDVV